MEIVDFGRLEEPQLRDASRILREAISGPSYKKPGEAETETASFLAGSERFALAAIHGTAVRGWVGAIRGYSHGHCQSKFYTAILARDGRLLVIDFAHKSVKHRSRFRA